MRSRPIDVLRAAAVLLVLMHHYGPWPPLNSVGWMGVDLFFVLSGYLVSGLLFDELARSGEVRPGRFLLRRGFKIYPSFWIMILVSVLLAAPTSGRALACELLFLQNYGPGIWVHTWSLAVEEHFYLLLASAFAMRQLFDRFSTPRARVFAFGMAMIAVLGARVLTVLLVPARYKLTTFGTHVRIDALLCGVAVAWMLREPSIGPRVRGFVAGHRPMLLTAALLALAPAGALGLEHGFTKTLGLTFVYIGFALILLVTLSAEMNGRLSRGLAVVGKSSYSIYLWHVPLQVLLFDRLSQAHLLPLRVLNSSWVLMGSGVLVGIIGTHLIEDPFLRLRDRWLTR